MFDLFWSILNTVLLLGFIYFFFKVFRMGLSQLPSRQRLFAAPFLVIGIISLFGGRSQTEKPSKIIGADYSVEPKNTKLSVVNTLEIVLVRRKSDGQIDPVLSDSNISGFVFGRKWRYGGIREYNNQLITEGSMTYSLLGLEIMSFSREAILNK